MSIGNTQLIEYGIRTEQSDYRAHVCFKVKHVYLFETKRGVEVIDNNNYKVVGVWTKGIKTAEGHAVPLGDLEHKSVKIPEELAGNDPGDTQDLYAKGRKGRAATDIVCGMLTKGIIPLPHIAKEVCEKDLQLSGCDIITISQELRIQVKCDYKGGDKHLGGSGNLFLQTKECNPFGIH